MTWSGGPAPLDPLFFHLYLFLDLFLGETDLESPVLALIFWVYSLVEASAEYSTVISPQYIAISNCPETVWSRRCQPLSSYRAKPLKHHPKLSETT